LNLSGQRNFGSPRSRGSLLSTASLVAVLLLAIATSGFAQQQEPMDVVRVNTDLVVFDAQVIDKKSKRTIGDLTRDDFAITENGVKQEVSYFSRDELPLSIILLLDVSRSVRPIIHEIRDSESTMKRIRLPMTIAGRNYNPVFAGMALPKLYAPNADTAQRMLEFFTVNIRNPDIRKAYGRAAADLCNMRYCCSLSRLGETFVLSNNCVARWQREAGGCRRSTVARRACDSVYSSSMSTGQ